MAGPSALQRVRLASTFARGAVSAARHRYAAACVVATGPRGRWQVVTVVAMRISACGVRLPLSFAISLVGSNCRYCRTRLHFRGIFHGPVASSVQALRAQCCARIAGCVWTCRARRWWLRYLRFPKLPSPFISAAPSHHLWIDIYTPSTRDVRDLPLVVLRPTDSTFPGGRAPLL